MEASLITSILLAIPLLPFFSFLLLAVFGKQLPRQGDWLAIFLTGCSFICSVLLLYQVWPNQEQQLQINWFQLASHTFQVGLWVDKNAALMDVVVTFVSLLVQVFSVGYMHGEGRYSQYFAYIGLFTFAMLGIVLADNLFLLYACWELVGLSSYLLIGFWFTQTEAALASRNAFFINRIGDIGFLIALLLIYGLFGSSDLRFLTREAILPHGTVWALVVGLGLFCGTIAKSAQFPLQLWLPRAMAGPTPVSALIHAATMVAAGVYLLLRVFPLLDVVVLNIIAVIGAVTVLMGAIAALCQTDIKRLLAFSTISQLGYMVLAVGVAAPGTAMFHLITHAFFKAGLFLSAGAVIHALHGASHHANAHFDVQDMRLMGGLRHKLPLTFICFSVCGLSLAGLPLFSGFLSKDTILAASLSWAASAPSKVAFVIPLLGFLSALLTAVYVGRQLLLVFFGEYRLDKPKVFDFIHEAPWTMRIPLVLLAVLSFFIFFSINPLDAQDGWLLSALAGDELQSHDWHFFTLTVSSVLAGLGLLIAYYAVIRNAFGAPAFLRNLSLQNWYLEEAFRLIVILPGKMGAWLAQSIDRKLVDALVNFLGVFTVALAHMVAWVDRFLVDGVVRLTAFTAGRVGILARAKSGQVQTYFIIALLGFLIGIGWLLFF